MTTLPEFSDQPSLKGLFDFVIHDESFDIKPSGEIFMDTTYAKADVVFMEAFYQRMYPPAKRPSLIHNGRKPR